MQIILNMREAIVYFEIGKVPMKGVKCEVLIQGVIGVTIMHVVKYVVLMQEGYDSKYFKEF